MHIKLSEVSTKLRFKQYLSKVEQVKYKLACKNFDPTSVIIALFGAKGAGKTSTVNSIHSTVTNSPGEVVGHSMNLPSGHVTKFARKYEIGEPPVCVIYDAVGLDVAKGNYTLKQIESYVEGLLIGKRYSPETNSWDEESPNLTKAIGAHVIAIVMGQQELSSEGQEPFFTKVRQIIELAVKKDLGVMIIITKIDQACNQKELLKDWYVNKEFKKKVEDPLKEKARSLFGVNKGMIHCLINYDGSEGSLNMDTTNRLLDILECANNCIGILPDKAPNNSSVLPNNNIRKAW